MLCIKECLTSLRNADARLDLLRDLNAPATSRDVLSAGGVRSSNNQKQITREQQAQLLMIAFFFFYIWFQYEQTLTFRCFVQ